MFRAIISIKKEMLLLLSDKVGLILMFAMPLLLVFIITIIQDSAFKLVESKKITLLVSNQDEGVLGEKMISLLDQTEMFTIIKGDNLDSLELAKRVNAKDALTALLINSKFTDKMKQRSSHLSSVILADLGVGESVSSQQSIEIPDLLFIHDPVLQESYSYSIISMMYAQLNALESGQMIKSIYSEMGVDDVPEELGVLLTEQQIKIEKVSLADVEKLGIPTSTQHNVPAWTIFAMFFMVVSLGSNIVKERSLGSFLRIKTLPTSFALVLFSKLIVYMLVAVLQLIVIFSIGLFVFPFIDLPVLTMPSNIAGLVVIGLLSGLAAVSYAMMIGSIAKTQEQSNGIGAVSIIIFAALGGVWVPTFVMPEYMQIISQFSPLHWCLEGFYVLFLKAGAWAELVPVIGFLLLFSGLCQLVAMIKLRMEKLI